MPLELVFIVLSGNYLQFAIKKAVNPKTNCFVCMDMKL